MMDKSKWGVHKAHCCYIHGCKYGDPECPVVNGLTKQDHLCWDCVNPDIEDEPYTMEEIEKLLATKSKRLTYGELRKEWLTYKEKCFWQDKQIELDGEKLKALEEENKNLKLCRCCECQSENEYMLKNTIQDLQEENAKLKKDYEFCHNDLRSKIDYIHEQDEVINYYKAENEKLREQLSHRG